MNDVELPDDFPDPYEALLPSRAYLMSFRDQTLAAREAGLDDAEAHYREVAETEGIGRRDMALLGLVADAMQPVEDVGYLGKAYESGFAGVPFYVTATVYDARTPNNFYSSLKNWPADRLKVLLGLSIKNPQTG